MKRVRALFNNRLSKDKAILGIVLMGLIFLSFGIVSLTSYAQSVNEELEANILRFHVVANSDSTEDQMMKQQVKDEIIAYMEPMLSDAENIEESKEMLQAHFDDIKKVAKQVINKWGKDYNVQLFIDHANFPTKSYGDIVLPAGEYEAFRVILGEGEGENWWCIMFPPLCYVDVATGVVPIEGKEALQEQLTEEQYEMICGQDAPYEVRFKVVDMVNELLQKENYKEGIIH